MASEPITIGRLAHRGLHNRRAGVYVSFGDLAAMLADDEDFVIHRACSSADITRLVLNQIIVQRGGHG